MPSARITVTVPATWTAVRLWEKISQAPTIDTTGLARVSIEVTADVDVVVGPGHEAVADHARRRRRSRARAASRPRATVSTPPFTAIDHGVTTNAVTTNTAARNDQLWTSPVRARFTDRKYTVNMSRLATARRLP